MPMNNGVESMGAGGTPFTCAVVTLSDKGAAGKREDTSGAALMSILEKEGYSISRYVILPDDADVIVEEVLRLVDEEHVDLVVTTGGTGVAPTDVTPEAMRKIIEKEIPGMAEAMRSASLAKTPHAMISRAMAGIRRTSLIINLPGSRKGAVENIEVVLPALRHALQKIKGDPAECGG